METWPDNCVLFHTKCYAESVAYPGGGHGGHGPPRNVSEWPSNINRIILYNLLPSLFTKYNKWYDVLFIVVKYCYNIISIFLFFSANLVIISSVCRWIERS